MSYQKLNFNNKKPNRVKTILIILLAIITLVLIFRKYPTKILSFFGITNQKIVMTDTVSFENFRTDASKTSIDLKKIISGGPGKDQIPALIDPAFVSVEDAGIKDKREGILITGETIQKFYPFNILTWHEIVNDELEDQKIAVTFCPLCGSAIVFDRTVDGQELTFKVSGYLYESNLLMYDTKTESFWSQALGEAVVGDYLGTKLKHVIVQRLTFAQAKKKYPEMMVLSKDTGDFRNYAFNPYSGYEDNDQLFFPVSVENKRFPMKEKMYVIPLGDKSLAFPIDNLKEGEMRERQVSQRKIKVIKLDGEIIVTDAINNNQQLPGYYEMWFSWAVHHQEDGVVWDISIDTDK